MSKLKRYEVGSRPWLILWFSCWLVMPISAEEGAVSSQVETEKKAENLGEIDDEDLIDVANDAADSEVMAADDVLIEDERVHGKQWLTGEMLVCGGVILGVLHLFLFILVIRSARKRGMGKLGMVAWGVMVLWTGVLGGVLYWLLYRRIQKQRK